MPKEVVIGSQPIKMVPIPADSEVMPGQQHYIAPDGQTFNVVDEGLVQVSWGVEQEYVQIATGHRHPVSLETNTDEWWFIDLDRRAINALIRNLRRARDQAYGKDE